MCTAGTYGTGDGQPAFPLPCQECTAGMYSRAGVSTCTFCLEGKISAVNKALIRSNCAGGMYIGLAGHSACATCPAGSYSSEGATVCLVCSTGRYSGAGQSACSLCAAGTSSAVIGAESSQACAWCFPGQFSQAGSSRCFNCGPGIYSDGTVACAACPSGTFTASPRTASIDACTKCRTGTYATGGPSDCTRR